MEFMYLVFTRMPGESYRGRLRSLILCLCYVFRVKLTPSCVNVHWFIKRGSQNEVQRLSVSLLNDV